VWVERKKLCELNPSKAQKTQTFVWEPIFGFNLEALKSFSSKGKKIG
jgi:hypothetical protein